MERRSLLKNSMLGFLAFFIVPRKSGAANVASNNAVNDKSKVSITQVLVENIKQRSQSEDYILVGNAGADPKTTKNRIPVFVQRQDGSLTPIPQPIKLGDDGLPIFNGRQIELFANKQFSLATYDKDNNQKRYYASITADKFTLLTSEASTASIGDTTLAQLLSIDVRMFGAHPITEPGYENFDSAPAFRAAIAHVAAAGGGSVHFTGKYKCLSAGSEYVLPYDDGSVSPKFSRKALDSNISAEEKSSMPVCLEIPSNVKLQADSTENSLIDFGWRRDKGDISTKQMIGIVFRVLGYPKRTRMDTYVSNVSIDNFKILNAFIGWLSDGVMFAQSRIGNIFYHGCGIPAIAQGVDSCAWGSQTIANCYAGIVVGGMWLQRNNVQLGGEWVPPYNNNDIFALGWCDMLTIDRIAVGNTLSWSDRHRAIDKFFDDYFYKSKNSATTSEGGRLSNVGMDLKTKSSFANNKYRGIAGRAFINFSRYNRGNSNLIINDLKVYFLQRTPVLSSYGQGSMYYGEVRNSFIERVGFIDYGKPDTADNRFYESGVDGLNQDMKTLPALVCEGSLSAVRASMMNSLSAPVSTTSLPINNAVATLLYTHNIGTALSSPKVSNTALRYLSLWDGKNGAVIERLWPGRFESQPIAFDAEDKNPDHQFKHRVKKFTPELYNGVSGDKLPLSHAKGSCVFLAGITKVFIEITLPQNIEGLQNVLTIGALPKNTDSNYEFGSTMPILHVINAALKNEGAKIMTAALNADRVTLSYTQNAQSDKKVNIHDLVGGSVLSLCLEYNTSWHLQ
ncbi:Head binding [Serratia entomophila]|uniref:Bacteriophage P22 tailspike N-terminal domain-containing protein n=1 Tax=Serratia entomophila TaxID=42906 RepID=A0ABY5CY45_9GAMM|nr:phage tailspike protein [Serratia entomophila]UIW19903.1 phage head-binding domain-containing protein [Serratia entomophila]USV02423.1 hypothetical protein KFQ06_07915 [Serratia entomophila]CAI0772830.1 Head binding [Serratia entomophila]CAI0776944.1 Head binding [Serratia entomophila]CAI0783260.1 Head binding [Serratia entomophila]